MRLVVFCALLVLTAPAAAAGRDRDRDRVPDNRDACPDLSGTQPDGCPPPDSDNDGRPDAYDGCPTVAADPGGHDGCPSPPLPPTGAGSCAGTLSSAPLRVGLTLDLTIDCAHGPVVKVTTAPEKGIPPELQPSATGKLYWNQDGTWERWEAADGTVTRPLGLGGYLLPTWNVAGDCVGIGSVFLQESRALSVQCSDGRNLKLAMPGGQWTVGDDPERDLGFAAGHFWWDNNGLFRRFEQRDSSNKLRTVSLAPVGATAPAPPPPSPAAPPPTPGASAPTGGPCAFPRSGGNVEVTLVNTQSDGAVTAYIVDGACAESPLAVLQPRESLVRALPVGQLLVARRGAMDPAGAATHWFWPLAADAPAVRVPSRPFATAASSCHGAVLGVRRAPFVPAYAQDALLFRCDGRAEVMVVLANGMAMKANPSRMPAEGSQGTLWFGDGHWDRFVADSGEVFQTAVMDEP